MAPSDRDSRAGPVRLFAGDFAGGRHAVRQEIALYRGTHETGNVDLIFKSLLDIDSRARVFVLLIKRWARENGLAEPAAGSTFPWTMLAIFALQQLMVLPAIQEFCNGVPFVPATSVASYAGNPAAQHPRSMTLYFADLLLDYMAQPHPRPTISIWRGCFLPTTSLAASQPSDAGVTASVATAPSSSLVLQELHRLKSTITADVVAELSRAGPTQVVQTPVGNVEVMPFETPPPTRHEAIQFTPMKEAASSSSGSGGSACASAGVKVGRKGESVDLPPLPPFPGQEPTPSSSQPMRTVKTGRGARWHITEDWIAIARSEGCEQAHVQLDQSLAESLPRDRWERRFNRREHQIRIAKATEEYRLWKEYIAHCGATPADIEPPHVAVLNSKRDFESAYLKWRIALHQSPPSLRSSSSS